MKKCILSALAGAMAMLIAIAVIIQSTIEGDHVCVIDKTQTE